jgi:hypothetical protein
MTSDELAHAIKDVAVESNARTYRQLLEADRKHTTDEYWTSLQTLYDELNDAERTVLISAMRRASIDACSTILSIIDNVTTVSATEPKFELRHAGQPVSGDLQDVFLAAIEDEPNQP